MKNRLFLHSAGIILVPLYCCHALLAQNTSPYWSLAGNSNASATTSKLGTTKAIPLRIMTKNLERIRVDTFGRVGIGTTAPTQVLHVKGNAYVSGNLGLGVTPVQKLHVSGNGVFTGNVGIGTTAPSQKLHVVGSGLFTTGLTVSTGGLSSSNSGTAVSGNSTSSYGVYGNSGYLGVYGNGTSYGVYGSSSSNYGVYGSSGYIGVYGVGTSYGVYGFSSSNYGLYGNSTNGVGVYGYSTNLKGGYFYSVNEYGLWAKTGRADKNWAGVFEGNVYTFGAYQTSDKNLKKNIEDFGDAMHIINKLKPKSYEFRNDGKLAALNLPRGRHYGLLAQDLEEVLPTLVMEVENEISTPAKIEPNEALTPDGKPLAMRVPPQETTEKMTIKAVNYTELMPLLIKAIQELSIKNESLQQQVENLKQTVSKLEKSGVMNTSAFGSALSQNNPNPVKGITSIQYSIPQNASNAQLVITDNIGRLIKNVQLNASGIMDIDASGFSSGIYNYSLVVDNRTLQTKKMTVLK